MKIIDNYNFVDFFRRLVADIEKDSTSSEFNAICVDAHPDYKGTHQCAYNIAAAFTAAHSDLMALSANSNDWAWAHVHSNEYANLPWSKTPLRYLFHREVPTFGNTNTPHVSKVSYRKAVDSKKFLSSHTAGYKMIVQHAETAKAGENLFSIDTGNDGNIWAGHYFDMNKRHLAGELQKMLIGDQI